jgi:sugar porter (SP) family MFS transporter
MRAASVAAPVARLADAVVSHACGRRRSGRSAVVAPERCTRLGGEAVVTTRLERMTKRSERRAQRKRAARSTFRVSASAASPPIGPTFTSDDDYRAEGERALRRLTFAVCLSMVSFGCATGAIAGALLHLESANTALGALTAGVKSQVIAATPLGALLGALVAGPFGDKTGRRSSILVGNALFLLGAGLMFTAVTPTQLTCGRLCAGLAVGFSTSLCTVYIGECAPAAQRGQLSSYAPLGVTVGILAAYFASLPLTNVAGGWRLTLAMCALPAAAQLCIKDWLVESPRWLAERGDVAGAQASLNALGQRHVEAGSLKSSFHSSGPGGDPGEHEQGGDSSRTSKRRGVKKRVTFASLVTERRYRKPAAIACGLNVAQQLCGINVVVYFAPRVLNELGFQPSVAIGFVCAIGVLQLVVGSKIGAVIDTYGRRPVALGGIAGLAAGLTMLATSSHLTISGMYLWAPWIAVLGILVFRLSFSASMAPIPYVMSAEVFPSEARSVGAAAGAAAREVANVVVTGTFIPLVECLGATRVWVLYVCVVCGAFFVVRATLPETRGRTLESMDTDGV